MDFTKDPNNMFFFRFSQTKEPQYIPSTVAATGNDVDILGQQGVLGYTRVIGANKVNEFKFGMNYFNSRNIQQRARAERRGRVGPTGHFMILLFWGILFRCPIRQRRRM
ncbi:MAG: hypothetical protein R2762_12065 [Bryobacteraceae bacterium]